MFLSLTCLDFLLYNSYLNFLIVSGPSLSLCHSNSRMCLDINHCIGFAIYFRLILSWGVNLFPTLKFLIAFSAETAMC